MGFSQGAWNIGYIHADSINESTIGIPVKIDFKHDFLESVAIRRNWVRNYIQWEDSTVVFMDRIVVQLIEKRFLYTDHGSFDDQYILISPRGSGKKENRIYDTQLLKIEGEQLLFELRIETYIQRNGKWLLSDEPPLKSEIWLSRDQLDGLMIKI